MTEVFTSSTPVPYIFSIMGILFLTFGYGFPALVLREVWVRNSLSIASMYLLGLVYGLYNEGLFSRALVHPFRSPIESFATYGVVEGIRVPFLLEITSYHAFFAIIIPILITHYLFPNVAHAPWIQKKTAWIIGVFSITFSFVAFLVNKMPYQYSELGEKLTEEAAKAQGLMMQGNVGHALFFACIGTILTVIAFKLPRSTTHSGNHTLTHKKLLFTGAGIFLFIFLIPVTFAAFRIPLTITLLFYVVGYAFLLKAGNFFESLTQKTQIMLMLYAELFIIILGTLIGIHIALVPQIVTLCVSFIACVFFIRKINTQRTLDNS